MVASRTNLRLENARVTLSNLIRYPYPHRTALKFLSITQNRYTESQPSKIPYRGNSTRARKREINPLREVLYVDTNEILSHLSQAGLEVKTSGLMKGKDLGAYPRYVIDLI